jgi:fucose 4-O-acetylase-like acetyltransferase
MSAAVTPPHDRDFALDLVRAIAIIEVIFAHTDLPPLLDQLRNFGVPLLLVISGMAFSLRHQSRPFSFPAHIVRRVRQLLLPTWLFLAFYFLLMSGLDAAGILPGSFGLPYILDSFLLQNSAPFVWVIRVNLLVSLIAGLLLFVDHRANGPLLVAIVLALLAANDLLWRAFITSPLARTDLAHHIESNAFYALSYGAMFLLGMRLARLPRWSVLALAALSGLVFVGIAGWYWSETGVFVPTQSFKYPPRAYYIAYALLVSLALLSFRNELAAMVPPGWPRALLGFIGANTLWIYLWHILALRIVERVVDLGWLPDHWSITWPTIVALSVAATWLQHQLWRRLAPAPPHPPLRSGGGGPA